MINGGLNKRSAMIGFFLFLIGFFLFLIGWYLLYIACALSDIPSECFESDDNASVAELE